MTDATIRMDNMMERLEERREFTAKMLPGITFINANFVPSDTITFQLNGRMPDQAIIY